MASMARSPGRDVSSSAPVSAGAVVLHLRDTWCLEKAHRFGFGTFNAWVAHPSSLGRATIHALQIATVGLGF